MSRHDYEKLRGFQIENPPVARYNVVIPSGWEVCAVSEKYTIEQLSAFTGFTTRSLRNYLARGTLGGEKENGAWRFTGEDVGAFFRQPQVVRHLRAQRRALATELLAAPPRNEDRMCAILCLARGRADGRAIADFFCACVADGARDVEFSYGRDLGGDRFVLLGRAEQVERILKRYWARLEEKP